jgi:Ca-activated chloride channel family protein
MLSKAAAIRTLLVRTASMNLLRAIALVALSCALSEQPAVAEILTDANIVTALDVSDSIDPRTAAIEIGGMAQAIRAPEILQAIRSGRHGRIGFAIFAWRDGAFPELVSWSIIASGADALAVSRRLEAGFQIFLAAEGPEPPPEPHMTDLSGAIDHGAVLLLTAPFAADRSVLNVIGNGWDNVGEGPQRARDRIVAKGVTVNGVVLGYDPVLMDYYRSAVVGGPGAFLLSAESDAAMADVLARKFLYDVAGGDEWPRVATKRR